MRGWIVTNFVSASNKRRMKRKITMEEAAELSIECSKMNRGLGDRLGLLEEMADMYICLSYLSIIHDVDYEDICYAIRVKLLRYLDEHGLKSGA